MLARHKAWLTHLFAAVQSLRSDAEGNHDLCLAIQEELLSRITRAEGEIRGLRTATKARKAQLAKPGGNREKSRRIKAEIDALKHRVGLKKHLISILRDVGDALAFIYFNRWDIKPFAFKEDPGFISGKKGTRLERAVLRRTNQLGAVVIMNDLTHSLRHGDVTVQLSSGQMGLMELKSGRGGNRDRAERQMAATQSVIDYINNDERKDEEAGVTLFRRAPHREAVFHVDEANAALHDAIRNGHSFRQVEAGLTYICIADGGADLDTVLEPMLRSGQRPCIISCNELKQHKLAYYPFVLSIADPETAYAFVNGDVVLLVATDLGHVTEFFRAAGLGFSITADSAYPWQIAHEAHEQPVSVGFHIVGRLGAEFLSLAWLLEHFVESAAKMAFSSEALDL